jgi:hypothetical protein
MRGDMTQQALDLTYGLFRDSGGTYPTVRELQREFNRQGNSGVDAVQVVRRIPLTLLKPLFSVNGSPAPT